MTTKQQAESLARSNGNVVSSSGEKIGAIGQIYVDDSTGEPTFVTVKTGLFDTSQSFVPLDNATPPSTAPTSASGTTRIW